MNVNLTNENENLKSDLDMLKKDFKLDNQIELKWNNNLLKIKNVDLKSTFKIHNG